MANSHHPPFSPPAVFVCERPGAENPMALMVPIKIQCGCGQRYAFEVEPVAGQMPAAVSCPKCGTDGTTAANAVLSQQFQAQPAVAVATPNGAAAPRVSVPVGGSQIRVGAPSTPSTVSIPAPQ